MGEMTGSSWVPDACTLPTHQRPLRVAEFTDLFTRALCGLARPAPDRLRLDFRPSADVEATLRDLTARESACCSFFQFTIGGGRRRLTLDIGVPAGRETVLEGLADQATAAAPHAERG